MAFVTFKSDYFGVHLLQDKTFCLQIPTRWSLLDGLFPHSTLTADFHTPGLYLYLISDIFPSVQKLKATFYETSMAIGHTNRRLNLNLLSSITNSVGSLRDRVILTRYTPPEYILQHLEQQGQLDSCFT